VRIADRDSNPDMRLSGIYGIRTHDLLLDRQMRTARLLQYPNFAPGPRPKRESNPSGALGVPDIRENRTRLRWHPRRESNSLRHSVTSYRRYQSPPRVNPLLAYPGEGKKSLIRDRQIGSKPHDIQSHISILRSVGQDSNLRPPV
jgi:hypothetical protein